MFPHNQKDRTTMKLAIALFVLITVTCACSVDTSNLEEFDSGTPATAGSSPVDASGAAGANVVVSGTAGTVAQPDASGAAGTYIIWPPGTAGSAAGSTGSAGTGTGAAGTTAQAGTSGGGTAGTGAAGVMAMGGAGSTGMAGSTAGTKAVEAPIKVEYKCINCNTPGSGDLIHYSLKISATGLSVDLSTYTIYYWFSYPLATGTPYGNLECSGTQGNTCTAKVKPYTPFSAGGLPENALVTANLMEEIKLKGQAIQGDPSTIEVWDQAHSSSQTDDYSFNGNDVDFANNLHIAVYADGQVAGNGAKPIQGIEPIAP